MRKIIIFQILLSAIFILIFECSNLDILLQDYFYNDLTNQWLITKNNKIMKIIFYDGIKIFIILFGISNLIFFILSFYKKKIQKFQNKFLYVVLCLIIIPSLIACIKNFSNVYCPYELIKYGGDKPYVKTFQKMPEYLKLINPKRGKSYPAGHASGGFALVCLYYVFRKEKDKILGLSIGLSLGGIMGLYQVARGAHFISHNFMTMFIALTVASAIYFLLESFLRRRSLKY
ncbi:MAG TPA: phosphatase PAP2 family protein [bacterium]|nr:phosphatase PAP2 family protein [bacterium]HPN30337.1 phosphatase PAP2 family protein [bacterium]